MNKCGSRKGGKVKGGGRKFAVVPAFLAVAVMITGCQTRITAEKYAEQVLPIQKVVQVNGEDKIITTNYQIASGGWYATARSPLYATEALEGLDLGVETNGTVRLALSKYARDLSTNAAEMVDGMFKNGANLVVAIGETYAKIAGGGAQANTVLTTAAKVYNFFAGLGGNIDKANVSAKDGKMIVSDGTICVECDKNGNCAPCAYCEDCALSQ